MNDTIQFPLSRSGEIADDTYAFWFEKSDFFTFCPGQYMSIMMRTSQGDEWRDFTIASAPYERELLFVTKLRASEFKKALLQLKKHDSVLLKNPAGGFCLRDTDTNHHVFLAGGIGITPFRSMILDVIRNRRDIPITLIASFASKKDIIFYDELSALAKEHPQIQIVYTLTKEDDSSTRNGEIGRINSQLIEKYVKDKKQATYFIVGAPQMVEDVEEILYKMGVAEKQIRMEMFSGY